VLHVSPESAVGGPLAAVRTGDRISLDVEGRRLDLLVDDAELSRRLAAWRPPAPRFSRGYGRLFLEQTTQANLGCDFGFLERGDPPTEPDIF
jgi:dihydroxy-acid dehydratase